MKSDIRGLITVALLVSSSAQAIPLAFIETTDFGNTNTSGPLLGTFDIGVNSVSGNILALAGAERGGSDYGDFWEADLLAGHQITGIDIILTGIIGGMRAFAGDNIIGCCADDAYTARAFTQQNTSGTYALTTTDPFSGIFTTGAYPFAAGHYYFGTLVPGRNFSEYSYEWQITVTDTSSVPEPSTLTLIGLAGLAFRRKRNVA